MEFGWTLGCRPRRDKVDDEGTANAEFREDIVTG
jgi:hypothetical protein